MDEVNILYEFCVSEVTALPFELF